MSIVDHVRMEIVEYLRLHPEFTGVTELAGFFFVHDKLGRTALVTIVDATSVYPQPELQAEIVELELHKGAPE